MERWTLKPSHPGIWCRMKVHKKPFYEVSSGEVIYYVMEDVVEPFCKNTIPEGGGPFSIDELCHQGDEWEYRWTFICWHLRTMEGDDVSEEDSSESTA